LKKIYFASDFHLGIDTEYPSELREKYIVEWLNSIKNDAEAIYLLGDILDYWFEYGATVPKGFTRLFGKLAELSDSGIHIEWYTGNHDMWDFGYFSKELGVEIFKKPQFRSIRGKTYYLCHGDGLGHGDWKYKFIKAILSNRLSQVLFSLIPSSIGLWMMRGSSQNSRNQQKINEENLRSKEKQLFTHFREVLKTTQVDYFIYGHLHSGKTEILDCTSAQIVNLGDWTSMFTFGVVDDSGAFTMHKYQIPNRVQDPNSEL